MDSNGRLNARYRKGLDDGFYCWSAFYVHDDLFNIQITISSAALTAGTVGYDLAVRKGPP